jgi:hypothetical protein
MSCGDVMIINWFTGLRAAGRKAQNTTGKENSEPKKLPSFDTGYGGGKPPPAGLSRTTAAKILYLNCEKLRVTRNV